MKELWKEIVGYGGKYKISNIGRVKRVRFKCYPNKEKILRGTKNKTGYIQTVLGLNGVMKIHNTHRLVAMHFIPNPQDKPQVNHIDGNPANNNVSNLEWCTPSENGLHAYRVLGNTVWHRGNTGGNTPTAKPVIQMDMDGNFIKRWECGLDAVRGGGFDSSCISRCCRGKSGKHRGFTWKYV